MAKNLETKKNVLSDLRYNEYYDMQDVYDKLYHDSTIGKHFTNLYEIISSRDNILLAYRSIKSNSGSKTAGTNKRTIEDLENMNIDEFVEYFQARLNVYVPTSARRVEIPKTNGKKRPLGIPNIEDRMIQECVKQVLEPICEAKFNPHSYGFRPDRRSEHAVADLMQRVNLGKNYYVIDFDIKGFFDNVDHGKLIRQIWAMGIRDKKVICIIKKMLKAPIKDIGIPKKGVPQGGILSPLLANIVLNELDWWIYNQWEGFPIIGFKRLVNKQGRIHKGNQYRALRKSKLKEIYIVRYADDFKVICKTFKQAKRTYYAVKNWLKERLHLDISEEKSGISDIRKKKTEFLGFSLKCQKIKGKEVIKSHVTKKAQKKMKEALKTAVKEIKKKPNAKNVLLYNAKVRGYHNYYKIATEVSRDFKEIHYKLMKTIETRLKSISTEIGYETKEFKEKYKKHTNVKPKYVNDVLMLPIECVQHKHPMMLKFETCRYTEKGREKLGFEKLKFENISLLKELEKFPTNGSVELNDNRLSKFTMQQGKCGISGKLLDRKTELHHIRPRKCGGGDEFENLILIQPEIHKIIHARNDETIEKYLSIIKPDKKMLTKINEYRIKAENFEIVTKV